MEVLVAMFWGLVATLVLAIILSAGLALFNMAALILRSCLGLAVFLAAVGMVVMALSMMEAIW